MSVERNDFHPLEAAAQIPVMEDARTVWVVVNEHSTNRHRITSQIDDLKAHPRLDLGKKNFEYIFTQPTTEDTIEAINDVVNPEEDSLMNGGGDGTMHDTLMAARRLGLRLPTWLFAGGNANNGASMANGRSGNKVVDIMLNGAPVNFYPLEQTATAPDGTKTYDEAMAYAGRGASAGVAIGVNNDNYRKVVEGLGSVRRLAKESAVVTRAVNEQDELVVTDLNGQRSVIDISDIVGSKMAKGIRIAGNAWTNPQIARTEVALPKSDSPLTRKLEFAKTLSKVSTGRYATLDLMAGADFTITTADPSVTHFNTHIDGEPVAYPSGTSFHVEMSKTPSPIWAVRL
jgi:hypothetical protein